MITSAMLLGESAFVVYNVWPTGEERMTVNLFGFAEAYDLLQSKQLRRP